MKKIIKKIDSKNRLTVFTVIGKITANEFIAAIGDFYDSSATTNVLWDFTKSDLREITSADVENIVNLSVKYAEKRSSGKTAIVGSDDLTFGLLRMYEMTKEMTELPFETQAFRDIVKAYKWLLSN
ncbi:MAG: hypothetical protein V3S72_05875 [Desulfobacterales bacterium]